MKQPLRHKPNCLPTPLEAFASLVKGSKSLPSAAAVFDVSKPSELFVTQTSCLLTASLIAIFGILQIADGIVTYLGLDSFGLAEANPVLNIVAGLFGVGAAIAVVKLCGLGFITFLFVDRHNMKSGWITATLASADTFYGWVLTNNLSLVLAA